MGEKEEDHGPLLIGWASADITPDGPVQLMGQYYERISKGVRDPISATVLALERGSEQAVIVSCDLVEITEELQERVRALVAPRLPGLDPGKVVLAATHIHTGPVFAEGWYPPAPPGVMTADECCQFLAARIADAIQEAWAAREPGGVSWALARAVVGHNRRVAYSDGTAQMYGETDTPRFAGLEGGEDHGVELLFTWDAAGELTGVAVNVACPSQVVEHLYYISADYWGEVRKQLRARRSPELFVLPLCAAAGDQSPRDLVRAHRRPAADAAQHGGEQASTDRLVRRVQPLEPDMWSEPGLAEIGRRVADAVESALPAASAAIQTDPVLRHVVAPLDLPARLVTEEEAEAARARYEELSRQELSAGSPDFGLMRQLEGLLKRYERQGSAPLYHMELHVLRLGDVALATNPFELYLDYGLRIKARSKAQQTFIVQLAGGSGWYLPTARAVPGGGYSARVEDNLVGPEGGQVLVERTVEAINSL